MTIANMPYTLPIFPYGMLFDNALAYKSGCLISLATLEAYDLHGLLEPTPSISRNPPSTQQATLCPWTLVIIIMVRLGPIGGKQFTFGVNLIQLMYYWLVGF